MSRRQAERWSEQNAPAYQEQMAAAPSAAVAPPDPVEQLRDLAQLRDEGVLTDQEFAQQKARLLGS